MQIIDVKLGSEGDFHVDENAGVLSLIVSQKNEVGGGQIQYNISLSQILQMWALKTKSAALAAVLNGLAAVVSKL